MNQQLAQMSQEEIEDRFYLSGRNEINFALNDLINHRETVTVFFNHGKDLFLTTLLAVRPRSGRLIFDWTGDDETNRRFLLSERSTFVGQPDGIKVQFSTGQATLITYSDTGDSGEKAFAVDLPKQVIRLQRREYFRILASVAEPVTVAYRDGNSQWTTLASHNISVAGTAIVAANFPNDWVPGLVLSNCRLTLPERTEVAVNLKISHITEQANRAGDRRYRIGFAFVDLVRAIETHIQRYVIKVEHARHALEIG
jgi:c-di-GMP-binding flagellar brake protein YcgR